MVFCLKPPYVMTFPTTLKVKIFKMVFQSYNFCKGGLECVSGSCRFQTHDLPLRSTHQDCANRVGCCRSTICSCLSVVGGVRRNLYELRHMVGVYFLACNSSLKLPWSLKPQLNMARIKTIGDMVRIKRIQVVTQFSVQRLFFVHMHFLAAK